MALVPINDHSVKVPPKPMKTIRVLDKIFRRRYVKNTQYYFTNRAHMQGKGKVDRDIPFIGPKTDKLLSYIKYSDCRTKLLAERYRWAPVHLKYGQKFDKINYLSKRVYIAELPDDVKTVVNIHAGFHTVIEGRPLRSFDDIKVYIKTLCSYNMCRQQLGYRKDLMLRIAKNESEESKEYEEISDKARSHVSNFQLFLLEDHKKVVAKLAKLDKLTAEIQMKNNEILGIISCITMLNNTIFKLDAVRNILKIYRTYCLFVAPISWRQQYDESLQGRLQSIQFETGVFSFDNDLMDYPDIDKTLECVKIEFKNKLPPVLYFKKPQQMMNIFRGMELQSREYLIQLSNTCTPYRSLQQHVMSLKESTKIELDYFQFSIDYLTKSIEREDYNANYLRNKFFRILNDTFYNIVASPETLKLKMCIEFVYEQVLFLSEEVHQSLREPMVVLEELYEEYYLKLDALDFDVVKSAQHELYSQDLKYIKRAHLAQRELKSFKEMTNSLNRAHMPPVKYKKDSTTRNLVVQLLKKSTISSKSKVVKNDFSLTEDERDGLLFFTEWQEGTDPVPYLPIYRDLIKPCLVEAASKFSEKKKENSIQ